MKAWLVYATGAADMIPNAAGHFLKHDDRWFRSAGCARDGNTTYEGMLLNGAKGPPNTGCAVYIEITEPMLGTPYVVTSVR